MLQNFGLGAFDPQRAEHQASLIFAGFVLSIYFLHGVLSNAIAVICFLTAWAVNVRRYRAGSKFDVCITPITIALLVAVALRLLLPPYGSNTTVPGSGVTRLVLLVGLFGVVLNAYACVKFNRLLWIIALAAFFSSLIGLGWYLHRGDFAARLVFADRSTNPILGAGSAAVGVAATIVLFRMHTGNPGWVRAGLVIMVALEAAAIYLSGSRGPILAFVLALVCTPLLMARSSWTSLFGSALAAWIFVSLCVFFEEPIKRALCPLTSLACRSSFRPDVWIASLGKIAEHPFLGLGYDFRFQGVAHSHNAYIGLALHYGVPLLALFVAFMAICARDAMRLERKDEKLFVVFLFLFANGFMGSDLSDPIKFINTHYVFLWLPLFLAIVGQKREYAIAVVSSRAGQQQRLSEGELER